MKQRFSSCLFCLGFLAYLSILSNSAGAPAQTSGAPGEPTCGRSGCHAVLENQGDAIIELQFGLEEKLLYVPNEIYPLRINMATVQNESVNGFQIVALDSLNNNAGSWNVTDSLNTQIRIGTSFSDRSYLTHTKDGVGQTAWNIEWQAPTEAVGPITFYLAVNDADANGGRTGDDIYITNLSINSDNNTNVKDYLAEEIKIYPNPSRDFIYINSTNARVLFARLYTANGQLIQQLVNPSVLDLTNVDLGLYLLEIQTNQGVAIKKVLRQ